MACRWNFSERAQGMRMLLGGWQILIMGGVTFAKVRDPELRERSCPVNPVIFRLSCAGIV